MVNEIILLVHNLKMVDKFLSTIFKVGLCLCMWESLCLFVVRLSLLPLGL